MPVKIKRCLRWLRRLYALLHSWCGVLRLGGGGGGRGIVGTISFLRRVQPKWCKPAKPKRCELGS